MSHLHLRKRFYRRFKMSSKIYCGNNAYEIGDRRLGTPYECLRKGIGIGKKIHYEKIKYKMENNNYYATFFKQYWPIVLAVGVGAFLLLTTDKDLMVILGWSVSVFFTGWVFDKFVIKK